jgi:hypothetical protein
MKIKCRDASKIPCERLFYSNKKLYKIAITVEGPKTVADQQIGGSGARNGETDKEGGDEDNFDDIDDLDEEESHGENGSRKVDCRDQNNMQFETGGRPSCGTSRQQVVQDRQLECSGEGLEESSMARKDDRVDLEQGLKQNSSLEGEIPVPNQIMDELEEEGISKFQVMIRENVENIWEEDVDIMKNVDKRDVMETLLVDLLGAVQELAKEAKKVGMARSDTYQEQGGDAENEAKEEHPNMKHEGKKKMWGPIKVERRSTRIINDGTSSLEKTNDKKKMEDLGDNYNKGKPGKASRSNASRILNLADKIGISLGGDEGKVDSYLDDCLQFEGGGVEVHKCALKFLKGMSVMVVI